MGYRFDRRALQLFFLNVKLALRILEGSRRIFLGEAKNHVNLSAWSSCHGFLVAFGKGRMVDGQFSGHVQNVFGKKKSC